MVSAYQSKIWEGSLRHVLARDEVPILGAVPNGIPAIQVTSYDDAAIARS